MLFDIYAEATAEEFFVPYVWSSVVSSLEQIPWNLQAIALFTPTIVAEAMLQGELSPIVSARGAASSTSTAAASPEKKNQQPVVDNV